MNPKNIGISGTKFLLFKFGLLFLAFAVGQYFFSSSASQVTRNLQFLLGTSLWSEFSVKLLVVGVYTLVMCYLLFVHVLDTPLWRTRNTPKEVITFPEQIKMAHNGSYTILFVGILLSGVAFVVMLRGANFQAFMYAVLTRGAIGELFGDLLTILVTRFIFKVKSLDEFKTWVNEKYNDDHAELVRGLKLAVLLIALSL
jgi:hypothetical protein